MLLTVLAMYKVCKECGQDLPRQAEQNCSTHEIESAEIPDLSEEQIIEFGSFESPLQEIKEENGFITVTTDSEEGTRKISCTLVRQRVDDVINMSKYEVYADTENCKIILTGKEDDVPRVFISFKTSVSFDRCLKALEPPFRPHLNSSVQHNRPIPTKNHRREGGPKTVTPKTLHKLNSGQFQPELVTLNEVKISSINEWTDEHAEALKRASEISQSSNRSDLFHGQSDEDRSSSGSDLDTAVGELRVEDVHPSILQGGRYAKDKRNQKTVKLTSHQFDALQVKKLLDPHKLIITRGGVFNQVTLLEGDEIMKVNGQKSQSLNQENYYMERHSEAVIITVRSCPTAICASNIPNNVKGLGVTWNNTVVEDVGNGPLAQDSVSNPLRVSKGKFSLTHVNGNFIPFHTGGEKICRLLEKAGECVSLVFQPTQRMKAVAGLV